MNVQKLTDLLQYFKDKDIDIVLDTHRTTDEFKNNAIYDLTNITIECKDKMLIKFAFEERISENKKENCRIKNMNIDFLKGKNGENE